MSSCAGQSVAVWLSVSASQVKVLQCGSQCQLSMSECCSVAVSVSLTGQCSGVAVSVSLVCQSVAV